MTSKKQFLCNKKSYCNLVQNEWMKLLLPSHLVTPIKYRQKKLNLFKISKFSKMFFKNFIKFQNFHKISKFSRILCNETITTLELDQCEVLWSSVQQHWTRLRLVQSCCSLLHKTSYWPRSSAVIVYYWCTKPGRRAVIKFSVRGIDFSFFWDFSFWFWNCSDSVVFCVFPFISIFIDVMHVGQSLPCIYLNFSYDVCTFSGAHELLLEDL